MKKREGVLPGGHRFRIERTDPEGDARRLALRIGDAIQYEQTARLNADFYSREVSQVDREVQKLERILDKVRRRDAGEVIETESRMDPALTYSAAALAEQIRETRARSARFRELAAEYMVEATLQRQEHERASRELAELREELNGDSVR